MPFHTSWWIGGRTEYNNPFPHFYTLDLRFKSFPVCNKTYQQINERLKQWRSSNYREHPSMLPFSSFSSLSSLPTSFITSSHLHISIPDTLKPITKLILVNNLRCHLQDEKTSLAIIPYQLTFSDSLTKRVSESNSLKSPSFCPRWSVRLA